MTLLTQDDLLSHADYEAQRQAIRQRIIELKKRRRIGVGPLVTLVFENRETLLFQIQEMIRVERIFDPKKIQAEIDVYNALLPGPGELSATLMIEITDDDHIQEVLNSLKNMDRSNTLAIRVQEESTYADFETGHSKEDKISAVHFVRFRPGQVFIKALRNDGANAVVHITHENYVAETKVPDVMRQEWLFDLEC